MMNKKGFAISMLLYSLVFVIISLLYVLLAIMKTRYQSEDNLRESIVEKLNEKAFLDE